MRATKLSGTDKVIQLLECCDEQLWKDLTRNAGGTITVKMEEEVLVQCINNWILPITW